MRVLVFFLIPFLAMGCGGEAQTTNTSQEPAAGQTTLSLEELAERNQRSQWFKAAFETCGDWYESGLEIPGDLVLEFEPMAQSDLQDLSSRAPILSGAPQISNMLITRPDGEKEWVRIEAVISDRPASFETGFKTSDAEQLLEAFAFQPFVCAAFARQGEGKARVNENINVVWDNVDEFFEGPVDDSGQGFFQMNRDFSDHTYHLSEYRLRNADGGDVFGFFFNRDYETGEHLSVVYLSTTPSDDAPFSALYTVIYPG